MRQQRLLAVNFLSTYRTVHGIVPSTSGLYNFYMFVNASLASPLGIYFYNAIGSGDSNLDAESKLAENIFESVEW